jgi:hypothetical protein
MEKGFEAWWSRIRELNIYPKRGKKAAWHAFERGFSCAQDEIFANFIILPRPTPLGSLKKA